MIDRSPGACWFDETAPPRAASRIRRHVCWLLGALLLLAIIGALAEPATPFDLPRVYQSGRRERPIAEFPATQASEPSRAVTGRLPELREDPGLRTDEWRLCDEAPPLSEPESLAPRRPAVGIRAKPSPLDDPRVASFLLRRLPR